jgi:ABC-type transport system involved in cytochrome bd biosynthesis fused ATPase/permease subunit
MRYKSQVSLRYDKSSHNALDKVSIDIAAGHLVLVVGTNGSGKSSLLKLVARLCNPTEGEVLIDGIAFSTYNSDDVRASMAFLPQLSLLYPMSVKENICLVLPPRVQPTHEQIQEAAKMGGCTRWISKLQSGYDTQLKPTYNIGNGWAEGVYGIVSERVRKELTRHENHTVTISGRCSASAPACFTDKFVTGGEKQRLVAYVPRFACA